MTILTFAPPDLTVNGAQPITLNSVIENFQNENDKSEQGTFLSGVLVMPDFQPEKLKI
jgi:hypothetical protein